MSEAADRVLELLRAAPGPVAGTAIGEALGVSRAAVWKQVHRLIEAGYDVSHKPSVGYALEGLPDRLFPVELEARRRAKWVGLRVEHHESIGSTNDRAKELARAGATAGTVVVAEGQSAGRGRLGRSFFSPQAKSLYASIVLRPDLPPWRVPQLTLVAGMAVAETVEAHAGERALLKWPNDVHLGGLKVAGLLTELETEADGGGHVICGPGVNLNVEAGEFPEELRAIATSVLATTGRRVDRVAFATEFFERFERLYERFVAGGFAALRSEWNDRSALAGQVVRVAGVGSEATEGRVLGVDEDGALRLETAQGETRILSGEVTLRA